MIASLERRFFAEILGTFGFLFIAFSGVAVAVIQPDMIGPVGVAAGFGLGLALMIFAFGHISGGHFNPAVSLGLAAGGGFPWREVVPYWIAQFIGACAAVGLSLTMYGDAVRDALVNTPGPGVGNGTAVVLEAFVVALFVIVISAVATDTAPWSGVLAPIAIGGFIFVVGMVVGPFSGFSFNPARAIAPSLFAGDWSHLWIYLVGPLVGGVIGGWLYAVMRVRPVIDEVEELAGDA